MSLAIANRLGALRRRAGMGGGPPPLLWAPALIIGGLLLLSPVYLAVRSAGAGVEFWDAFLRVRVLEILLRTPAAGSHGHRRLHPAGGAAGLADGAYRPALGPALGAC